MYTTYYNTGNFSVYGSSKFKPSRTSPVNNELKQQGGAGETSRTTNYVYRGWVTRAPVAETLQTGGQFKSYIFTYKSLNKYLRVVLCTMLTYLKLGKKWFIIYKIYGKELKI